MADAARARMKIGTHETYDWNFTALK